MSFYIRESTHLQPIASEQLRPVAKTPDGLSRKVMRDNQTSCVFRTRGNVLLSFALCAGNFDIQTEIALLGSCFYLCLRHHHTSAVENCDR